MIDSHDSALESMDKDIEGIKTDIHDSQQVNGKLQTNMYFIEALRMKTKQMNE